MDPVTLATLTSAVSVLASEVAKGIASDGGKDIWKKIKSLFAWSEDPDPATIASRVAEKLVSDNNAASQIFELLKTAPKSETYASSLVQHLQADKVVVTQTMNVSGNFQM